MKELSKVKQIIPTVFSEITTPDELKQYLNDNSARLKNSAYLYHYTTLSRAVDIIRSGMWHLGNAQDMNDKLEFKNGDLDRWETLFFSCFMCEDKESIGMWSMYAQPWEKGVKISIPRSAVRKWIKSAKELREISTADYEPTGKIIPIDGEEASLWLSSVSYCNADSLQKEKDEEKITWSNQTNTNIKNASHLPELTGYIKDMAWSYEKEVRIKASLNNYIGIERVAIPLTDELINSMIITASPLFDGNLLDIMKKEIETKFLKDRDKSKQSELLRRLYHMKTDRSMFTDRLQNIRSACNDCDYKKQFESK